MTIKKMTIEERILSDKLHVRNWDYAEDNYCRQWYGARYLGDGFLKCEFCLEEAVQFQGYFSSHVCMDCQESLKNLG